LRARRRQRVSALGRFARAAARRQARRRVARLRRVFAVRARRRQRVSALGLFVALRLAPVAAGPGWLTGARPDATPVAARTDGAARRTMTSATTIAAAVRITAGAVGVREKVGVFLWSRTMARPRRVARRYYLRRPVLAYGVS
jgi:hypothetical protein